MSDGPDIQLSRRAAIRLSIAGSVGALLPAGCTATVQAIFTSHERRTLAAVAETIVPGAEAAQVVDFVAAMLADSDPMLCYRFVSFPMPPLEFYRASLDAIVDLSGKMGGHNPDGMAPAQRTALIGKMLSPDLRGWKGPPASLVYFVIRNDAIDAVYGDTDAYARLDVPYMAHIPPPRRW